MNDNDTTAVTMTKEQARIVLASLERRFESLSHHGTATCPPDAQEVWDAYQNIDKQIQWDG